MAGGESPTRRKRATTKRDRPVAPAGPAAEPAPVVRAQGAALLVALPAGTAPEAYPLDLSGELEEWSLHLDPVAEVVELATGGLGDWTTLGHAASPTERALAHVREAARREELTLVFRASEGVLLRPDLGAAEVRIRATTHGDRLDSRALPILLGLAVLCAESWPVGRLGAELARRTAGPG